MGRVLFFLVASCGMTAGCAAERLIPFDDFYVSVDTNWRAARGGEGEAFHVNVRVSRSNEEPEGSVNTDVSCTSFDSEDRDFSKSDLATFFEAFEAARNGDVYQKEILSKNVFGYPLKTRFKADKAGTKPIVRVGRGKVEVYFSLDEAENTKEALTLAKAAEEWYKKLLSETKPPEITPSAHPPPGSDLFLISTVGQVPGGGFAFEVSVNHWGFSRKEYTVEHGLVGEGHRWSTGGDDLVPLVTKAIEAGKAGQPFAHQSSSGRSGKDDAVYVTVNPASGKAEVMIKFGEGLLEDQPLAFATFGETELAALRELEAEAEVRKKWFEGHESLFFVPPPQEP